MADDLSTVEVQEAVPVGNHIRPTGDDVAAGDVVFTAGTELSPAHLGVCASIGVYEVMAYRRPRIGVISTGDELVDEPRPLEMGQIHDSNRHTLLALVNAMGADGVDLGLIVDDEDQIRSAMSAAAEQCDAVITSGGVSMGDFDYVKKVLTEIGDMRWMQVAIKPAKPLAFGTVGDTPIFGLPGNPVSSMVSFELFARPGYPRNDGPPRSSDSTGARRRRRRSSSPARREDAFRPRPRGHAARWALLSLVLRWTGVASVVRNGGCQCPRRSSRRRRRLRWWRGRPDSAVAADRPSINYVLTMSLSSARKGSPSSGCCKPSST